MIPFHYKRISQDFVSDLDEKTRAGESVVLLGPRYIGKRYLMRQLRRAWEARDVAPVIELQLLVNDSVCTGEHLEAIVRAGVSKLEPRFVHSARQTSDPLQAVRSLAEREKRPVHLLVANVDAIAHHLARTFLQSVRTLVEDRKIIAVMSGEVDFHELVYGPNSEFDSANQYVLQGYTEEEFKNCLQSHLSQLRLSFEDNADGRYLWQVSGGSIYIMGVILGAVLESRTRDQVPVEKRVTVDEINSPLATKNISGRYGSHVFRHTTQIVERAPECWSDLALLISGQTVLVDSLQVAPGPLELAGIAVRDLDDKGRQILRVSSPFMGAFVRQYYDEQRFGDLYASIGDWDKAFGRYRRLGSDARKRPSGADDRIDVEATINALISSIDRAAKTENLQAHTGKVMGLFANGCRYVLGFSEITLWDRAHRRTDLNWVNKPLEGNMPTEGVMTRILAALPLAGNPLHGLVSLLEPANKFGVAASLPASSPDEETVIVVSDFEQGVVISRERERLLRRLTEHFVEAYAHAVLIDKMNSRVVEKMVATLTHNLGTRLGAMPVLLARYRDLEGSAPELSGSRLSRLNDDFQYVLEEVMNTVKRAQDFIKPVVPRLANVDLSHQIEVTLMSFLPEEAWSLKCNEQPFNVQVDQSLFEAALLELVQNSRNAAHEVDNLRISITLQTVGEGSGSAGWVRLEYRDNGPGIPIGIGEHVFEDFYSYRPGRKSSTGLGMGFVRRVIEAHGGRVVWSPADSGVEFVISFPKSSSV